MINLKKQLNPHSQAAGIPSTKANKYFHVHRQPKLKIKVLSKNTKALMEDHSQGTSDHIKDKGFWGKQIFLPKGSGSNLRLWKGWRTRNIIVNKRNKERLGHRQQEMVRRGCSTTGEALNQSWRVAARIKTSLCWSLRKLSFWGLSGNLKLFIELILKSKYS